MILLGEGNVYVALFADALTDQLILEAVDEAVGTDDKRMILALASGKCHTVAESFVIDYSGVAVLYGAILDVNLAGVLLLRLLKLFLNLLIGNGNLNLVNRYTLVLAERNFRLFGYGSGKYEILALADLGNVNLGTGYDLDAAVLCSLVISLRNQDIGSILIKHRLSVHLGNDGIRCLTFPETLNVQFVLILLKCLLAGFLKIGSSAGNRQLYHVLAQIFNLITHYGNPPCSNSRVIIIAQAPYKIQPYFSLREPAFFLSERRDSKSSGGIGAFSFLCSIA